jgi:hypothetical protein
MMNFLYNKILVHARFNCEKGSSYVKQKRKKNIELGATDLYLGDLGSAQILFYANLAEGIVALLTEQQLASVSTPPTMLKIPLSISEKDKICIKFCKF